MCVGGGMGAAAYLKYFNFFASLGIIFIMGILVSKTVIGSEYSDLLQKWLEAPSNPGSQLEDGKYSQRNLSQLADYFPPGYFEEFDFNDVEIFVQKDITYQPHEVYTAATKRYQKRSKIRKKINFIKL